MTTLREAAQQALEALETCDAAHPSDGGRQWYDDKLVELAITALRAALAQEQAEPAQEPVACHVFNVTVSGSLHEWEPTTFAFALKDGKHALYTTPPAPVVPPDTAGLVWALHVMDDEHGRLVHMVWDTPEQAKAFVQWCQARIGTLSEMEQQK